MKSDYSQQKKASQAFKKFVNYTDDLKNDPVFSSELKWFRQYYVSFDTCKSIPKNGLPFPKDKAKHDDYTMEYHYMMDKNNPEYLSVRDFNDKKFLLAEKYGLNLFGRAIDFLIFYNSVEPMSYLGAYTYFADVLDLSHMSKRSKTLYDTQEEADRSMGLYVRSELIPNTPVAILVNPYMSERDIIDFVKKTYKTAIQPIQAEHSKSHIKLGSVRTKSASKKTRDEFIYKNRKLPLMKLMTLVSQKFGKTIDYTYIQKIIRTEEAKRK